MTVYIEYVIIDNFIIDYLLLKTSLALSSVKVKRARLFFCALLGAGFSLLLPIISVSVVILALVKVLFGLLMVMLSAKFRSKREFYISSLFFFCFTFLTGGVILGVYSLLGLPYSTELSIAIMFLPVYFIVKGLRAVIKYVYRKKDVAGLIVDVELTVLERSITAKGFYDTGNGVYDGDNPVIICSKRFIKGFLEPLLPRLKFKKIELSTVNKKGQNVAISLQELKIYNSDRVNIFNNVTLVIVAKSVGDGYDVILHPALIEGGKYGQVDAKIEKVS